MESEPVLSLVDALFLCIAFLPDLPITSIFSARFEAGSKLARTCVPSRIEERSLELDPLLSTIWVLSSTVRVMRSPWRELMTRLLPSGSTFDTRPTADFRFAMLPADEPRSIDPREPEVPVEVSLWAVLLWPDVDDDVFAWPLRSLPIDEVPVDEPVFAVAPPEVEPLADPCVPLVEPCVATWPWLPAALWVPSTEPCVLVPVVEVFEAVRVSFCDPEHAAISAAAPSAVTK